ncbi:MAG: DUF192 domain-containing protein [Cyclobacteriaceae bacterium]
MSNTQQSPEDKISSLSSARKLLLLLVVVGAIGLVIYYFFFNEEEGAGPITTQTTSPVDEPQFVKEGELWFVSQDGQDTLQHISIEVADDQQQRAQGLMYRSSMAEDQGMLFIHDEAKVQSFWMKNTKIPLDIIYVSPDKEIVTIYQGVMPYSEKSVPSTADAIYVVEVNAGFTGRHDIEEGDLIAFEVLD